MLVLIHDDRLDNTTNGTGVLQEASWQELQELDVGSWFGMRFAGERIPLLQEALQRYRGRTSFDLEIKQTGIEYEVLNMVEDMQLLDSVTFTSQNFLTLRRLKERNPHARAGYITADISDENVDRLVKANIQVFCPRAEKVSGPLVAHWHALGLFVRACGVKNVEMMRHVIQAGVDGMTYDFPDVLLRELGRL